MNASIIFLYESASYLNPQGEDIFNSQILILPILTGFLPDRTSIPTGRGLGHTLERT